MNEDNTCAHSVMRMKVIIIPNRESTGRGSKSTPREKAKRNFPTHDNFSISRRSFAFLSYLLQRHLPSFLEGGMVPLFLLLSCSPWISFPSFRLYFPPSSALRYRPFRQDSRRTQLASTGLRQRLYQIVTPRRHCPSIRLGKQTMRNVFKGFQVSGVGKPKVPKMHSLGEVSSLNKGFSAFHAPRAIRPIHQSVKVETAKTAPRIGKNPGIPRRGR